MDDIIIKHVFSDESICKSRSHIGNEKMLEGIFDTDEMKVLYVKGPDENTFKFRFQFEWEFLQKQPPQPSFLFPFQVRY